MKKWFKMILLIVVLISALGGCGVNQKDRLVSQSEQDRVILYFMNNYSLYDHREIRKIEVVEFQQDMSSQVWFITLKVNDSFLISFAEDKLGDEIRSSSYSNKEFRILEEQDQNTGKHIKVIYLGECDD
ncbi:hypothetical protein [Streptococcus acidominimus]|nr:hypothetical protein [Streptococcus acidominimus]